MQLIFRVKVLCMYELGTRASIRSNSVCANIDEIECEAVICCNCHKIPTELAHYAPLHIPQESL